MYLKVLAISTKILTHKLRKQKFYKISTNAESQKKRIFNEIDPISKERHQELSEM